MEWLVLVSFPCKFYGWKQYCYITCSYFQDGDLSGLVAKDKYQYLPDLADLPDLDLPMELPSLPGTQISLPIITSKAFISCSTPGDAYDLD